MPPDQERLTMVQAALAGASLYGLWQFAALLTNGQTPRAADYVRAGVNMACAAAAGALVAYFLGPNLAQLIPWASLKDPRAFGFIIGAASWEALPVALAAIKSRVTKAGGN